MANSNKGIIIGVGVVAALVAGFFITKAITKKSENKAKMLADKANEQYTPEQPSILDKVGTAGDALSKVLGSIKDLFEKKPSATTASNDDVVNTAVLNSDRATSPASAVDSSGGERTRARA